MRICSLALLGCAARKSIGDRFDSVDQQLAALREQVQVQQQTIAQMRTMLDQLAKRDASTP